MTLFVPLDPVTPLPAAPAFLNPVVDPATEVNKVVKAILKAKRIAFVCGAGISVQAGIPDFRSSNGLFQSIKRDNPREALSSGKDLFDASVFSSEHTTALFCQMIAQLATLSEKAGPTSFHELLRRLDDKGKLLRVYTQNIDALESKAGLTFGLPARDGGRSKPRSKFSKGKGKEVAHPVEALEYLSLSQDTPTPIAELPTAGDVVAYDTAEVGPSSRPSTLTPPSFTQSLPAPQMETPRCIPLHGTLQTMHCQACSHSFPLAEHLPALLAGTPPDCPECTALEATRSLIGKRPRGVGKLRPSVVLYNEEHKDGEGVGEVAQRDLIGGRGKGRGGADLLIVVGTSLRVPGTKRMVREFSKAVRSRAEAARESARERAEEKGKEMASTLRSHLPTPSTTPTSTPSPRRSPAADDSDSPSPPPITSIYLNLDFPVPTREWDGVFDVWIQGDAQRFAECMKNEMNREDAEREAAEGRKRRKEEEKAEKQERDRERVREREKQLADRLAAKRKGKGKVRKLKAEVLLPRMATGEDGASSSSAESRTKSAKVVSPSRLTIKTPSKSAAKRSAPCDIHSEREKPTRRRRVKLVVIDSPAPSGHVSSDIASIPKADYDGDSSLSWSDSGSVPTTPSQTDSGMNTPVMHPAAPPRLHTMKERKPRRIGAARHVRTSSTSMQRKSQQRRRQDITQSPPQTDIECVPFEPDYRGSTDTLHSMRIPTSSARDEPYEPHNPTFYHERANDGHNDYLENQSRPMWSRKLKMRSFVGERGEKTRGRRSERLRNGLGHDDLNRPAVRREDPIEANLTRGGSIDDDRRPQRRRRASSELPSWRASTRNQEHQYDTYHEPIHAQSSSRHPHHHVYDQPQVYPQQHDGTAFFPHTPSSSSNRFDPPRCPPTYNSPPLDSNYAGNEDIEVDITTIDDANAMYDQSRIGDSDAATPVRTQVKGRERREAHVPGPPYSSADYNAATPGAPRGERRHRERERSASPSKATKVYRPSHARARHEGNTAALMLRRPRVAIDYRNSTHIYQGSDEYQVFHSRSERISAQERTIPSIHVRRASCDGGVAVQFCDMVNPVDVDYDYADARMLEDTYDPDPPVARGRRGIPTYAGVQRSILTGSNEVAC